MADNFIFFRLFIHPCTVMVALVKDAMRKMHSSLTDLKVIL